MNKTALVTDASSGIGDMDKPSTKGSCEELSPLFLETGRQTREVARILTEANFRPVFAGG